MKTNELKKETVLLLRNGWRAKMKDNKNGNIRMAEVYGLFTETGSIYAHDIAGYIPLGQEPNNTDIKNIPESSFNRDIEYTKLQSKYI